MAGPRRLLVTLTPHEVGAVAVVVASNLILNRAPTRAHTVAAAVGSAASMLLLAKAAGATVAEQGLSPAPAPRSMLYGLLVGVPITGAMALGAYLPMTRRFFQDERIIGADTGNALYELFVRIPVVTAGGEELVFRSALEGILSRRRSPARVALISAALFGAWHILPTLDRVHSNPGVADAHQGSALRQGVIVAGVCTATAGASLFLSWLRRRTGSVAAPIAVHYAVNAGGFAGGWLATRQSGRSSSSGGTG